MTINIMCKGVNILRLKNVLFELFHIRLMEVIEKKNIKLNEILSKLIDDMDQTLCGTGCVSAHMEDYLKNKNDLMVFLDLLEQTIEKCKKDGFREDVIDELWKFYDQILQYGDGLQQ